MSQLWIKICGITQNSDALAAANMGADAIGLVFYSKSPRAVGIDKIAELTDGIEANTKVVALFVDAEETHVQAAIDTRKIDLLQFHGDESESYCQSFGLPYLKAIRVKEYKDVSAALTNYKSANMLLLDSFSEKAPGGTGKKFNWELGRAAVECGDTNIVIAGGLDPDNVATAVKQIAPFGVDVSSGVEKSHGIKDLNKLKAFIEGARSARS